MRTDKERPEENTCRIVKGHRGMGVFLPVKTVFALVNRWYCYIIDNNILNRRLFQPQPAHFYSCLIPLLLIYLKHTLEV